MFSMESAESTPTSVTFGMSCPLATICVPISTLYLPLEKAFKISSCANLRSVESWSMRKTFTSGSAAICASAFCVRCRKILCAAVAFRAFFRHRQGVAAVMAAHGFSFFMVNQSHGAVRAHNGFTAVTAHHKG